MSTTRSRRATNRGMDHDTLEELKAIRSGVKSRIDEVEITKDQDVYELMTEDEYAALVAKRRSETQFVVDDADGSYADDGEEDWALINAGKRNKGRISKVARAPREKKEKEAPKPLHRVNKMLLGMGRYGQTVRGIDKDTMGNGEDDGFLDGLLDELDANPMLVDNRLGAAPGKRVSVKHQLKDIAMWGDASKVADSTNAVGSDEELDEMLAGGIEGALESAKIQQGGISTSIFVSKSAGTGQLATGWENDSSDDDDFGFEGDDWAPSVKKEKVDDSNTMEIDDAEGLPSAMAKKLPPRLPPKVYESGGYDWSSVSKSSKGSDVNTPLPTASSDSQSPVNGNDEMQFFWYDAFEVTDRKSSVYGSVFLFGQAMLPDGSTGSCCVQLKGLERNLFILPRKYKVENPEDPNSVTDEEVNFQSVWAETKEILGRCGIHKFGAKPVFRKYCFGRVSKYDYLAKQAKVAQAEKEDVNAMDIDIDTLEEVEIDELKSLVDPDGGIPGEGKYLKVVYSAKDPVVPRGLQGRTFSHMFGNKTTMMEQVLLKRDMMGPCWMNVKNMQPAQTKLSRCKFEFVVDSQKQLSVVSNPPPSPKLSVLSLSFQTVMNSRNGRSEIVLATGILHRSVNIDGNTENPQDVEHFTLVAKMPGMTFPVNLRTAIDRRNLQKKLFPCSSERELLSQLMARFQRYDPDIILSHDLFGFGLEVLMNRMITLKIPTWDRLGRLKKSNVPSLTSRGFNMVDRHVCSGRLPVDTQASAKEFERQTNFTLTHLADVKLKVQRQEVEANEVPKYFNSATDILRLASLTENDAWLAMSLMHKLEVLPLTKQLTNLCGNLWARSLRSQRAERVEYLLLHEFHRLKYISPEKYTRSEQEAKTKVVNDIRGVVTVEKKRSGKKRAKPAYSGGLVLEPKRGFYDKFTLLLDFKSLYPSIIQEFNICFTTTSHWKVTAPGASAAVPESGSGKGILPHVLTRLLERRKAVKSLLKKEQNPDKRKTLDIRQKALKLVANAMYGCLGFRGSRFYCEPLAALITGQGREILQSTVELSESMGAKVIYGDTDSIMVYTNDNDLKRVKDLGKSIMREVNKRFSILEIEIDNVYKNMLLLRKKKYAALNLVEMVDEKTREIVRTFVREVKGLDLVRRDWCPLSKDVGNFILDQILSARPREIVVEAIHSHLIKLKEALDANKVPLEKFIITKGLTRAPMDYPDANALPHVQVALAMLKEGKSVKMDDYIPYIVCKGDSKTIASRSYHPSTVIQAGGALEVDTKWYLSQQVLPPAHRLCAPIEETSAGQMATCLGLDGSRFASFDRKNTDGVNMDDDFSLDVELDDGEKFRDCSKLSLTCPRCKNAFEFLGVFDQDIDIKPNRDIKSIGGIISLPSGLKCPTPRCTGLIDDEDGSSFIIRTLNLLTLEVRKGLRSYYSGWLRCTDTSCGRRTRQVSVRGDLCPKLHCNGSLRPECSSTQLYTQLEYYLSLFDVQRAGRQITEENKRRKANPQNTRPQMKAELSPLHLQIFNHVHSMLQAKFMYANAYNFVDLTSLFMPTFQLR